VVGRYRLLYSDLRASQAIARAIVAIILVNLAAVCAESVLLWPCMGTAVHRGRSCDACDILAGIWSSPLGRRRVLSLRKLAPRAVEPSFALSPDGLIDLVAVLPFWSLFLLPPDFRILLVLRSCVFSSSPVTSPDLPVAVRRLCTPSVEL